MTKKKELTPEQVGSIDRARTLRGEIVKRRLEVDEELAKLRKEKLQRLDETIEEEVYRAAVELDVPKMRLAREVYGHSGATEVYRVIDRVQKRRGISKAGPGQFATFNATEGGGTLRHAFQFIRETGEVAVDYPAFQTTASASDYPDALRGLVVFDPNEPNNWRVVEDETDEFDARGARVPGWLHFEVDIIRTRDDQVTITDLLSKWWEDTEAERAA